MTNTNHAASTLPLLARLSPTRVYVWLGGLSLLLLVFLTPPFQVPDEPQHFYRSYQLSKFEVWSRQLDGVAGADLPASLLEFERRFLGTNKNHALRVPKVQRLAVTLEDLSLPLDASRTVFVDFSGIQFYAPLPYAPQAIAIAAGRYFDVGPLGLLYLARLANAFAAAIVTAIGLSLLPVGRTFALVVALFPMTQFMTASVSPDALVIASAFLFTAMVARFLVDGTWSLGRLMVGFASGLTMCIVKPVYAPLLFAGLGALPVALKSPHSPIRRGIWLQLAAAALTITAFLAWRWSVTPSVGGQGREGVDGAGQLAYLAHDPLLAVRIMVRSLLVIAEYLGKSTVGILGWLNVPLASWVYWLVGIALALSIFTEQRLSRIGVFAALWLSLLASVVTLLIELAMYLGWTPVGGYFVEGLQGRYFIPALPMIGLAFAGVATLKLPSATLVSVYAFVVVAVVAVTFNMHLTLMRIYGLF